MEKESDSTFSDINCLCSLFPSLKSLYVKALVFFLSSKNVANVVPFTKILYFVTGFSNSFGCVFNIIFKEKKHISNP